ncbi:type II CAAX prenyl endopeptidase Rce1 family protein [Streptomyces sp. NPDC101062]|uniref:CPBP family glutamic-type intramembrane protease n=1 Tax=unclassified Streptomyces TaxID=2593676 RepID=UPI003828C595
MTDLWGLLLLLSWDSVAASLMALGTLCGINWTPQAYTLVNSGQVLAAVGASAWLITLVAIRTLHSSSQSRAAAQIDAAFIVGTAGLYTAPDALVFICVLLWLALEICWRHGTTLSNLGITPAPGARTTSGRARTCRVLYLSLLICAGASLGMTQLNLTVSATGLALPVRQASQISAFDVTNEWQMIPFVARTLIAEDLILVAVVTALLTAARRPVWQIYAISSTLTLLTHAYLGVPALATVAYAAARIWLYRRHGRLIPMALGHGLWDTAVFILLPGTGILITCTVGAVAFLIEWVLTPKPPKGSAPSATPPTAARPLPLPAGETTRPTRVDAQDR